LLDEFIQKNYETIKQKKVFEVYAAFTRAGEEKGIVTASYKTFCQAVKRRARAANRRSNGKGPEWLTRSSHFIENSSKLRRATESAPSRLFTLIIWNWM